MSDALGDIVTIGTFGLVDGDDLTGKNAADAAKNASRTQAQAMDKAIHLQRETRDLAREDLAPFRDFGAGQINPLLELLTPQGQTNYVQANPLFEAALDSVNKATMANQAARGKLGSGGTLAALQNNYMSTAMPFINSQQNALFNAVNMGQSSAAGQANTAMNTGNQVSALLGNAGDAQAAGIIGANNAWQQAYNNAANFGLQGARLMMGGI